MALGLGVAEGSQMSLCLLEIERIVVLVRMRREMLRMGLFSVCPAFEATSAVGKEVDSRVRGVEW